MERVSLLKKKWLNTPIYKSTHKEDDDNEISMEFEKPEELSIGDNRIPHEATSHLARTHQHQMKRKMKRRQSSEGSFIHITGTGTILEGSLDMQKRDKVLSSEDKSASSEYDDLPPGVGEYEDFHTIDWQRDLARDRYRHRYLVRKMRESCCGFLKGHFDASSGWICVFLIGVSAGCIAAFIDIGEGWMVDLKEGICPSAFWLNKEQCCWSSNDTFFQGDRCIQWYYWSDFIRSEFPDAAIYVLSFGMYVIWSLLFAALASSMVRTVAPYACGSGIPEIKTILSGFIMRGYLGKMTLVVKSVTLMLSVAAGLNLGKEGPLVHVVCCIGNVFSYLFPKYGKNEAKKREILSAAAAAGVSVAFNAPIGGVLFSLEEASYYFPLKTLWRSFFCALVAAFVLRSINPFGTNHPVKYYMNTTRGWIMLELIPFVALGIAGGLIGAAFIRGNIAWCKVRKKSKLGNYPITEVMVITFVTAMVSYPNEFSRINSSDLIRLLLSQCSFQDVSPLCDYERNITSYRGKSGRILELGPGVYKSLYLLPIAFLFKWILTVFTFGVKVPAGLFVPSLAMGAIMGRMVGIGMQQLASSNRSNWLFRSACVATEDCLSPGLYAMIGATACLAGVTRMTVSLVVIMFELTGSVDYIVPLMATVVASKWVGDALVKHGIYDAHICLNKYPFLNNKEHFSPTMATDLTGAVRTSRELHCFTKQDMILEELENIMERTTCNGFPVVVSEDNPYLVGYVLRRDINLALDYVRKTKEGIDAFSRVFFVDKTVFEAQRLSMPINLSRIVDMAPVTVTVQTQMETVIDMFCKLGLRQILVTKNGSLLDIMTKKDILHYINKTSKNCQRNNDEGET